MIDVAQMTNKMVFGTWSQVGEKILPGDISITRGVTSVRKMQPQPLNRSIWNAVFRRCLDSASPSRSLQAYETLFYNLQSL